MHSGIAQFGEKLFLHGTKAKLEISDLLLPLYKSTYKDRIMNHIYFTGTLEATKLGDVLADALSKYRVGEHIYVVVPLGEFEDDLNVTDKKLPGNPTLSYRSTEPLKIVAELSVWERHSDDDINQMLKGLKQLRD